jgi:hypothetical protein
LGLKAGVCFLSLLLRQVCWPGCSGSLRLLAAEVRVVSFLPNNSKSRCRSVGSEAKNVSVIERGLAADELLINERSIPAVVLNHEMVPYIPDGAVMTGDLNVLRWGKGDIHGR